MLDEQSGGWMNEVSVTTVKITTCKTVSLHYV